MTTNSIKCIFVGAPSLQADQQQLRSEYLDFGAPITETTIRGNCFTGPHKNNNSTRQLSGTWAITFMQTLSEDTKKHFPSSPAWSMRVCRETRSGRTSEFRSDVLPPNFRPNDSIAPTGFWLTVERIIPSCIIQWYAFVFSEIYTYIYWKFRILLKRVICISNTFFVTFKKCLDYL